MKAFFRYTVPFFVALALVAWGASVLMNRRALAWAERDMAARARLALSGAQQALTQSDEAGTRRVLQALVRDERLMGAAVCSRDGRAWGGRPAGIGRSPPRGARSTSRRCRWARRRTGSPSPCWSTT